MKVERFNKLSVAENAGGSGSRNDEAFLLLDGESRGINLGIKYKCEVSSLAHVTRVFRNIERNVRL